MKKLLGSVLGGVAFFALPFVALAAPSIQNLTFSGQPNVITTAGSSVDATVWVQLAGTDAVDSVSYEFPGSGLPFKCVAVNPADINPGQYNIDLPQFTVPGNAGTWDVTVKTYSEAWPSVDANCDPAGLQSTHTFDAAVVASNESVVTSTSNSTGNNSSGSANSTNSLLQSLIAMMSSWMTKQTTPATPAASGKCAELTADMQAGHYGIVDNGNVALQGFLLANHESIPALKAGAAFGFWGPQSQAAIDHFKMVNNCQ